jgi:transposase
VLSQLRGWQSLLLEAERQVRVVETELAAAAPTPRFYGQGALTAEVLRRELFAPERFANPRQVGNYYGLCPSESSSGPRQRRGAITKHGHPRLRQLLIELAWRVVRYQPGYRALRGWGAVLASKASPGARKKAIVAVARHLAVDLWRLACGRVTLAELGLSENSPPRCAATLHPARS